MWRRAVWQMVTTIWGEKPWIWRLWDGASLEQRCKQPARCNKFRLLIFLLVYLNLLYVFRATNSPIFWSNLTVYTTSGTMQRYCCRTVTGLRWNWSVAPIILHPDAGGRKALFLYSPLRELQNRKGKWKSCISSHYLRKPAVLYCPKPAESRPQYGHIYLSNQPTWCTKFCFTIGLFHASTCFEHHVLIVRRSKLYYTASGIITPAGGRPVHGLREGLL